MAANKKYLEIATHYEACLDRYGDTHRGVDWPDADDARTRYRIMLELMPPGEPGPVSLLDFGCGASHLYEYIRESGLDSRILYSGLDISERFVNLSRAKFPGIPYYRLDLLDGAPELPDFDYVVMNGVFTEKLGLSQAEMLDYFQALVQAGFRKARKGLAFNVMSKLVDWERDDLFHLPFDGLTAFLAAHLSRHFVVRHDYRLFEYSVYVYR